MFKKLMSNPQFQQMLSRQRSMMQQPQSMPVGGGKSGIIDMAARGPQQGGATNQMPAGNHMVFQPQQRAGGGQGMTAQNPWSANAGKWPANAGNRNQILAAALRARQ